MSILAWAGISFTIFSNPPYQSFDKYKFLNIIHIERFLYEVDYEEVAKKLEVISDPRSIRIIDMLTCV